MHFDNKKPVVLACNASPYELGAVFSHQMTEGERVLEAKAIGLPKAEKNYSQIERETLALVSGVSCFRNYLLGSNFTLVTDRQPLLSLLSEVKPVPAAAETQIQHWALILLAYFYKIQISKGLQLGNADAFSRLPIPTKSFESPMPADIVLFLE